MPRPVHARLSVRRLGVVGLNTVRLPHARALLPEARLAWLGPRHVLGAGLLGQVARLRRADAIASWGIGRPFSEAARGIAARHALPYVTLEDGFLRSVRPGVVGEPGLSLVADPVGIYYDATRPSLLERLIAERDGWETGSLDRAAAAMALIRRHRVSKYNHASDLAPATIDDRVALVVDQRRGDVSVPMAGATTDDFQAMLHLAVAEYGPARVVVKTHPDAIVGGRKGYLSDAAAAVGARLVTDSVNPWALLDRASAVYTVSSLLGFEALIAGLPVTCFGLPFYAGWGLTRDRQVCARRRPGVPLEQVFAAAYLRYVRYVDDTTGAPCSLERMIVQLAHARDRSLTADG